MTWPQTHEEVDADLYPEVTDSGAEVRTSVCPDERAQSCVREKIDEFLNEIRPAGYVLIKTSTTGNRSSDHEVSFSLLKLVLQTVRDFVGPTRVFVGDGPVFVPFAAECERLGWAPLFRHCGVGILDFNISDVETIAGQWRVAIPFRRAGCVINLCKAKTHRRFGVSLGLKSLLGVLGGHSAGTPKLAGLHRAVPRLLHQLGQIAPPTLTIIDGDQGIEGDGPLNGRRSPSRFLCVGKGFYGPDLRATVEMGFDPILIPYFLRPRREPSGNPSPSWLTLRVTDTDFFPPNSCPWLYRSIVRTDSTLGVFQLLLGQVRQDWSKDFAASKTH